MIRQKVEALKREVDAMRPRKQAKRRLRIHYIFLDVEGRVVKTSDNPATPCPVGMSEDVLTIHVVDTPHTERPVESMSDAEAEAELERLEAREAQAAKQAKRGKR